MKEDKILDLNTVVKECGIQNDTKSDIVIKNINKLEEQYQDSVLISIYNHFLTLTKDTEVLTYLVKLLSKYKEESSLSPLIDILLNPNYQTGLRVTCAKAILKYKTKEAVTPLLYCLNNKNEPYQLRLACADALGKIGDNYAVAPLINIVQDEEEKSVYVRESAAVALGMLGDERAVDPLVSILETKKGFIDKFTFLKERIIEVLGKFNFTNDRILKALEKSLTDESSCVRINAIEAIMDSGNDNSFELIKPMLEDLDDEVKKNALIALYNLSDRSILDEVIADEKYSEYLKNEAKDMLSEYESDVEGE